MKKLIVFGALALTTMILIFSCQKEAAKPIQTTAQNGPADYTSLNQKKKVTGAIWYSLVYYPADGTWRCVTPGNMCSTDAYLISGTEKINLSLIQVLKLMEIGNLDLNEYFVKNQLRDEFPDLYEGDFVGQLVSGRLKLDFQFPYLFIYDNKNTIVQLYNYENELDESSVISALKAAAAGYDKKAELNTDVNKPIVWKCISAGDNCKTSASATFRFHPEWITVNYQYLYVPTTDVISKAVLTKDRKQIELTTVTSKTFVFEL